MIDFMVSQFESLVNRIRKKNNRNENTIKVSSILPPKSIMQIFS